MTSPKGAVTALLILVTACTVTEVDLPTAPKRSGDTAASGPSQPEPVEQGFPEITGPGRVFAFSSLNTPYLEKDAIGYATASRYVLYDDGRFALQYSDSGFEWLGSYGATNGVVDLRWDANSSVPPTHPYPELWEPWVATAFLAGDSLSVTYPLIMWLDGFQDAVYRAPRAEVAGATDQRAVGTSPRESEDRLAG